MEHMNKFLENLKYYRRKSYSKNIWLPVNNKTWFTFWFISNRISSNVVKVKNFNVILWALIDFIQLIKRLLFKTSLLLMNLLLN
jgi:hypothetical protein